MFSQEEQAEKLYKYLLERKYTPYIVYGENIELRVGNFSTQEAAVEISQKLEVVEKIATTVIELDEENNYAYLDGRQIKAYIPEDKDLRRYTEPQVQKIISLALEFFAHPYKYGGTQIGKGIDCSYFVQSIYNRLGTYIPRSSKEQFKVGRPVNKDELQPGDLVFFYRASTRKRINHVGIYLSNNEFIHALRNAKHVTISSLDESYFKKHFAGARRILTNKTTQ